MDKDPRDTGQARYRIEVTGQLDARWSEWFAGLTVTPPGEAVPYATLSGCVDQATLRGIVNRIWDLNLTLISLQRIPTAQVGATRNNKGVET